MRAMIWEHRLGDYEVTTVHTSIPRSPPTTGCGHALDRANANAVTTARWLVANGIPRVLGLDYRTPASANDQTRVRNE